MAIKTSTGLAAHLMVTGSVKDAFDGGFINVYSGTVPATADAAETTAIWTISVDGDGTGLTFDPTAVGRAIVKPTADTWGGATTAGTATYWRLVTATDDGLLSETDFRIQGTCGNTVGSDLFMSNPVLVTDTDLLAKTLSSFSISLPA